MKFILPIILSIFLTGCACFKKPDVPALPPEKVVNIDPRVLEYCDLLAEDVKVVIFEDAILAYADLSTKYGICANKQAASVKLLKQFSNKGEKL